jgi:hypothetical protein
MEEGAKKALPICHQNLWLKQAFLRGDKFRSEFLVLNKTNDEETKAGTQIFLVFRYCNQQIYAVKKVEEEDSPLILLSSPSSPPRSSATMMSSPRLSSAK